VNKSDNEQNNIKNLSSEEQLLYHATNGTIDEINFLLSSFNININYQTKKVICVIIYIYIINIYLTKKRME